MAKQLNTVNLTFNADTGKARQQLQELQTMLDKLVKGSIASSSKSQLPLTKELTEAQVAASKLQTILKQTTNANTGNLDLTKFSESINRSGLSLNKLQTQLNSLGADGQKAFISLASSIVSADVPLTRTSKLATELWTTLKNTARWQLSSSVLHGFMGTVQSAYGYAQDLNESLNNIRIVTGQNTEQMARFAEQANRAAKELSATTTDYTNASLIYYQQGLDDNQVAERTNVTIKMANAAGESAQKVSDQLTAVWNNFYEEGGKSLEYYADVMTALGAATASSTDEISEGLNKFASVAETVGLSYEYAASALATVTATTRQSADVVGTAFKTLFARIQDLELGETLEDGTTLGQYSEALNKVGVNIKDANGEIKEMDTILEEMAAKWDTLSKDQQISLAQSVAGVRQYTQLIALMDNWDFMKENLQVTAEAEGTLNEQAEIYAESWEAAKDRVRAAAEDIYDSLLDEDFFIGLLNGFEKVLTGVGNLVDAVGGLPGVLAAAGAIMTRVFSQQLAQSINNLVFGMKSLSGETQKAAEEMKTKVVAMSEEIHFNTGTEAGDREGQALKERLNLTREIAKASEVLTAEEREQLAEVLSINDAYAEQMVLMAKAQDNALRETQNKSADMRLKVGRAASKGDLSVEEFRKAQIELQEFARKTGEAKVSLEALNQELNPKDVNKFDDSINRLKQGLIQIGQNSKAIDLDKLWQDVKQSSEPEKAIENFKKKLAELINVEDFVADSTQQMSDEFHSVVDKAGITITECDELSMSYIELGETTLRSENSFKNWKNNLDNVKESIKNFNTAFNSLGTDIVKISQGLSSIIMGVTSLKGAFEALNNQDLSFGEKTLQVLQSLTMAIPSLIMGYKALTEVQWDTVKVNAVKLAQGTAELIQNASKLVLSKLETVSLFANAKAAITASKAYKALGLAKHATLKSTLILVAAIAALVAIAATVVKVVDLISDAYNRDALAAERAKDAANNLAIEYNNTKQAYEDMISSMDEYKTATDALATMTKGTEEYRDALKDANQEALNLISTYGLVEDTGDGKGDFTWEDNNSRIKIKDEALDKVKNEEAAKVSESYAASQMANTRATETQNRADLTDIQRNMYKSSGIDDGTQVVNAIAGAIGLALAPVTAGMSALVAAGIGAFGTANVIGAEVKQAEYSDALNLALEKLETNENLFDSKDLLAEELNINDQDLIDALWENKSAIQELSGSMQSEEAARKAAQQQAANELMSGKGYEDTQAGRQALEAGGRVYGAEEQAAYDKWMKTNLADLGIGSLAGKEMWKQYAEEAGLDNLQGLKLDYKDDRVKYSYIDDDGNKQEKEVTKEQMAQVLAAAEAAGKLESSMEALKSKIESLTSSAELADNALAEFLTDGNFEGATKGEYEAAKSQVTTNGEIDDSKVNEYLGLTGTYEENLALAQSYGYKTAQEYKDAFINALSLEWNIPSGLENIADKLTAGAADKINANMSNIGEEGAEAYTSMLTEATNAIDWSKLTPEESKAAIEAIANVDLSAWDAADQIVNVVRQYGGAIDDATDSWKANTAAIREAAGAVFDLDSWKSSTSEKHSVGDGLNTGDTISAEDYGKLGSAYSQFFQLQNDGTYKLIASAEQLRDAINSIESEKLLEQITSEAQPYKEVVNDTSIPTFAEAQNLATSEANNTLGDGDLEKIEAYKTAVAEAYNVEVESIQQAIEIMQQHDTALAQSQTALLTSVSSLDAFYANIEKVQQTLGGLDYNAYSAGLINLSSNYENCSTELENYQKALEGTDEEQINNAAGALEAAVNAGELAEQYDLSAEELERYADELKDSGKYAEATDKELVEMAKDQKRFDKAVQSTQENISKWNKDLKVAQKTGHLVSETAEEMADAYGDLLDIDGSELSSSFLQSEQNLKDLKAAIEGDEEAYKRLQAAARQDIATRIGLDDAEFQTKFANLLAKYYEGQSLDDISVGASLDNAGFLAGLTDMVNAAGMTASQATDYLSSMGVDAEVVTESKPVTETVGYNLTAVTGTKPVSYTTAAPDDGQPQTFTASYPYVKYISTPVTETKDATGTSLKVTSAAKSSGGATKFSGSTPAKGGSNSKKGKGGGGGGGGGSSTPPAKVEKTKKSDVVERYKEINDKLDDIKNATEDASRAADRLYGKNRIKEMKKVSDSLEKEVKLLKDKRKEAEKYLQTDKTALKNVAKDAGINFKFDGEGNIKNYEDEMTKLYNRLAAAEKKADPSNFKTKDAQDAYIEKNVTPLKEKIEALEEAIDQYDETRELIEDLDDEAQEKFNEWQDNNFEILNYELELKLEVDDAELRKLEYLLSKIEDDFYSMAEAGALMIGNVGALNGENPQLFTEGSELGVYLDKFEDLEDQRDALKEAFQKGDISEAAYIEGLQELEDQAYDNAEAIQDLDNTMMHYYGDTLEAAQEELSKYTDMMDQHVEVLEHYANVMDIIGKSTDYKSMGEILEAQAEVAENNLAVSKANYQMLDEQRNQRKAEYEAAIGNATDEELAVLKQKWLDAEAAANDAQDEMMADAEAWAEALRAVVENKLAGLAQSLEKALTADFGGSFDQMSAQMERARDLQEEYLTDTNKIYETNKLINKAQQDIDKTTNTVAKKRLQNYIKETEQLQNKAKLSNYELEIQQAKYDLVLAEIALEEAQNAKSTVRLQRDAEGNFGYVYTADSSKVAEAEQQLADAQNRLYNIGLEGANDYTEKYQQILAEMYDTLTELQTQYLEGAFASEEEYNTAVANAKEYYYAKLAQYSDLYTIALTTDSAVRVDAWSTDFDDMIYSTDKWQQSVNEYLGNVQSVFAEWETQVAKIREETVGKDLDALKQKTKDIKDESKKLKDQIADPKDGVIKAIKDEIEEVNKLTNAYAKARKQIKGTQTDHENFIKELRESIENPDKDKKKEDPVVPKKEEPKKEDSQPTTPKTDAIDYDKIKKGTKVEVKSGQKWYYDSYGISPTGTARDGTIKYINRDGTHPFNIEGLGWIKQSAIKKVVKYDTGGYTGSWGPQGKLAMLHEKELILNKHDTENFLASMDVLDRILQAIDLRAMSSQLGGILTSPTFGGQMKEEHLEQNVTIEANFPGVSMASEIEEAFENIVNLASQYANRK